MTGQSTAKLWRNEDGTTLVEFAFASPIIILMLVGAVQTAMMLHASAGMRHALGEAARSARVLAAPTQSDITTAVMNNLQSVNANVRITALTAPITTIGGVRSARLTLTYQYDPEFVLIDVPAFEMQATRTVYLQD